MLTSVELRASCGVLFSDGLIELEGNSARAQWGNLSSSTVMLAAGPGDARLAMMGQRSCYGTRNPASGLGPTHVADLRAAI